MRPNEKKLSRDERKALIAKIVNDCKSIAQNHIDEWKPLDSTWPTFEGCAYLRLSTDKQVMVEKGSLEQQVHIAVSEAEIKSRENKVNYRIVRFFIEPGITGRSDKRPEFNSLKDGIEKSLYKFVIAKELSRITRDDLTWHMFMDRCVERDCEFVVRGLRLNPRDPIQRHILNQLAGAASLESSVTSKRQMESNHTRLTISKRLNSTHPILGLDQKVQNGVSITGAYQNNADEGKTARWIFETFVSTESEAVTFKEIQDKGIKNKFGIDFTKGTLHSFLTNLKLIAKVERNAKNKNKDERFLLPYERYEVVELDYEPVISIELWNKAQAVVTKNADRLRKNTKLKKVYLLHGLIQLPDGSKFHGTGANGNGGRKNYYFNKASKLRIDADEVELGASKAVVQVLRDSEKLLKAIKRHSQSETRQELLKSEAQRFMDLIDGYKSEKRRAELRFEALLAEGSKDRRSQYTKEFETTIDRVETEIAKLQAQLDTLERSQTAVVDSFYDNFKQNIEAAKKIQEMISKKADPVYLKGAYAKLFKAVIAEPCQETGTFKLSFIIGEGESRNLGTNGGQGSVMTEVVRPEGLEPPHLSALDPHTYHRFHDRISAFGVWTLS
jgi:hypothetical protein